MDKKFVVLDVETNGLMAETDDLLSISIYKPDDEKTYNRFLPLEMNESVLTTHINGIRTEDLVHETPLNQEEVNQLIRDFELEERVILTYGTLDEKFLHSYFARKELEGFEKLKFFNMKQDILSPRSTKGAMTKDNLCTLLGIGNVHEVHTAENDCILEWELYKKMNGRKMLVIEDRVYMVEKGYRIPASFIRTYPNVKHALKGLPKLKAHGELLWEEKFYTPFEEYGAREELMSRFETMACHPWTFLKENEQKLTYVGSLPQLEKGEELLGVPHISEGLGKKLDEIIERIMQDLFQDEKIYSYELITDDQMYAVDDISSSTKILDIRKDVKDMTRIKDEMYFKAAGRECYGLLMSQETEIVTFRLYHLEFR